MQININDMTIDWDFQKAHRYLPVRLSTTFFDDIGECIALAANRADGTSCAISDNPDTEIFLTLMNDRLYEELKFDVLNYNFWSPVEHFNTVTGLADGKIRKIHLDGRYF